jgi:hypothetical protein
MVEQALLGVVAVGDLLDIGVELRKIGRGEKPDLWVLGLAIVGLVAEAGWGNGPIADPVDGVNAAAALLKSLLRKLPPGPAREAVVQMLRNPDDLNRIWQTGNEVAQHLDDVDWAKLEPETLVWLLQKGPDGVKSVLKIGPEAVDALRAAERLAEVGKHADEAEELIETIARLSTHGSGDVVVLGPWRHEGIEGFYVKVAEQEGAKYFMTPEGVYDALGRNKELAWEVNERFLRSQLEAGVREIRIVGMKIEDILSPTAPRGMLRKEIQCLMKVAEEYGYKLQGNSWVRAR